jgi:kumamolisin
VVQARLQDTRWPLERPHLTHRELEELFAPPAAVVRDVTRFAKGFGLSVVEVSKLRCDVVLEGSVADLDRAFGICQQEYLHVGGLYLAHEEEVQLPAAWADQVRGVLGLDTVPHGDPRAGLAPPGAVSFAPRDLARHYRFPRGATAAGQRVALLELGGGFYPEDIRTFLADQGLPPAEIEVVPVTDGGGVRADNQPLESPQVLEMMAAWRAGTPFPELASRYGRQLSAFRSTLEVTLDLEIVTAMAPGAVVEVYFAPQSADGWRRALSAALGVPYPGSVPARLAHQALPTAISISWGSAELTWGTQKMQVLEGVFELARRLGVTVCCASGDLGSQNAPEPGPVRSVNYPASSPVVLACGGTRLLPRPEGGVAEVAWKEEVLGVVGGSGGGMSGFLPRPGYQQAVTATAAADSWRADVGEGFVGRWVPDVAANAALASAVEVRLCGETFPGFGTSAAAPQWAALVAVLAAALGRPLGWLHPVLYRLAASPALLDVVEGDNDLVAGPEGPLHYPAGPGWDACTGLGVPVGDELLEALRRGPRVPGDDGMGAGPG